MRIEERINKGLNPKQAVIATGGSVVYGREAMEHLREIGVVVYLKLSCEAVLGRLRDIRGRGVGRAPGGTDPGRALRGTLGAL